MCCASLAATHPSPLFLAAAAAVSVQYRLLFHTLKLVFSTQCDVTLSFQFIEFGAFAVRAATKLLGEKEFDQQPPPPREGALRVRANVCFWRAPPRFS